MSRRTVALIAAVVLAGVATFALVSYVQGARDEGLEGASPVSVFVAKDTIPAGVSGEAAISQGLIKQDTRAQRTVPEGAITSLDEIKGRVAAVNILPAEVIVAVRFVAPGQAGGGLPVPAKRQAISVEVDVPPGVAGFIRQGDRVSVIAHIVIKSEGSGTSQPRPVSIGGLRLTAGAGVKYIVQNVEVLAVGQRVVTTAENGQTQETSQNPQNRILVTLAVTPNQAERLVFAVKEGDIFFTLVPRGQKAASTNGKTIFNEFPR